MSDGLCLCPHPHPWQSRFSEQMEEMRCGRQASAWPLGILPSAPVWLAARLCIQSCMIPGWTSKRKATFSREGGVWGYLSRVKTTGSVVAWPKLWLIDLSDTNNPRQWEISLFYVEHGEEVSSEHKIIWWWVFCVVCRIGFVGIWGSISASGFLDQLLRD